MFEIYGGAKYLKQYQTGQKLIFNSEFLEENAFCNVYFTSRTYKTPIVRAVRVDADNAENAENVYVDVPDILLSEAENIVVRLDNDKYKTIHVAKATKPTDYNYPAEEVINSGIFYMIPTDTTYVYSSVNLAELDKSVKATFEDMYNAVSNGNIRLLTIGGGYGDVLFDYIVPTTIKTVEGYDGHPALEITVITLNDTEVTATKLYTCEYVPK